MDAGDHDWKHEFRRFHVVNVHNIILIDKNYVTWFYTSNKYDHDLLYIAANIRLLMVFIHGMYSIVHGMYYMALSTNGSEIVREKFLSLFNITSSNQDHHPQCAEKQNYIKMT